MPTALLRSRPRPGREGDRHTAPSLANGASESRSVGGGVPHAVDHEPATSHRTDQADQGTMRIRATWVVLDQGVSSLTNFALTLLVARAVTTEQFGAFTVCLTAYFLCLGVGRSLCGEPEVVRYSHGDEHAWREATRAATGAALVLGITLGAVALVAAALAGGLVGRAVAPLGFVLPGLLLQDTWRYAFLAVGRPAKAFANDVVWAAAQIATVGWVELHGPRTSDRYVLAWGAAATLAAVFGVAQSRLSPRPRRARWWLTVNKDLGPRFAVEFLAFKAAGQVSLVALAVISGLAALGAVNAAATVLGPFRVVALGAVGFAVPEGVRIWRKAPQRFSQAARAFATVMGGLALACGGIALLLPGDAGRMLVGATWPEARAVLPFVALWMAAVGVSEAARAGLRVLAASRQSLSAQARVSPLLPIGTSVGAAFGGAQGASAGLAAGCVIGTLIWWNFFSRTLRSALERRFAENARIQESAQATGTPASKDIPLRSELQRQDALSAPDLDISGP